MLKSVLKYLESFWSAGFWTLTLMFIVGIVFNIMGLHFDVLIATIIAVALWVVLLLSIRRYVIHTDFKSIKKFLNNLDELDNEEKRLQKSNEILVTDASNPYSQFMDRIGITKRKLQFIRESKSNNAFSEVFSELMNDVDQTINSWYMPLQALVWSLPALGFLGTAWHMREAIIIFIERGLSENTLNIQVLSEIAPALIISFLIISFALGLTVITYIATALTLKADTEAALPMKELLAYIVFNNPSRKSENEIPSKELDASPRLSLP